MHAYTELLKPSVVTHSLILPLGNGDDELLLIVRGKSLLQVFSDIRSPEGPKWVAEFPLQGTVSHLTNLGTRKIVMTFLQAKMVVLEWDSERLLFATKSLHYYEKLKEQSTFDVASFREHHVSVDERNLCLTFWFQREYAAFVQFNNLADPLKTPSISEPELKARSAIVNVSELTAKLGVSEIVDMVHLPIYREPTLALLAWSKPTWAGLVGVDGSLSKSLTICSVKPPKNTDGAPIIKKLTQISNVPFDVQRVFPLRGVPNCLAVLLRANGVLLVNEAGELCEVKLIDNETSHEKNKTDRKESPERFENCAFCQLPGTSYAVLSLESGSVLVLDATNFEATYHSGSNLNNGGAACVAASKKSLVVSSRYGNTSVSQWSASTVNTNTKENTNIQGTSLQDLYNQILNAPKSHNGFQGIEKTSELTSYGPLSSISSIDNGLACSTNKGILIVERELPFDEVNTVPLTVDVQPGKFWVVSSTVASKPILITTYTEVESAADEDGTPKKRRRRSNGLPKEHTTFSEVFAKERQKRAKKASNVPRGIASDQLMLAVREHEESVLIVQSRSLSLFEARTWKLKKRVTIPNATFAEVHGDYILIKTLKANETLVHSALTLDLIESFGSNEFASVSNSTIYSSHGAVLKVINMSDKKSDSYDLTNLDKICHPLKSEPNDGYTSEEVVDKDDNEKKEENEKEENENGQMEDKNEAEPDSETPKDEDADKSTVIALFALNFSSTSYVGIHIGRVFTIYEQVGSLLLKRYSIPFGVNQSPVFLPEFEMLMFPGAKSHVVVKGRHSGFHCHRLQLYGDRLVDVTSIQRQSKSSASTERELVWLDDKEMLHFVQLDRSLDYLSNTMPLRHIPLEVPGLVSIKDIGYHEGYASILVGANLSVNYTVDSADVEGEEEQEHGEAMQDDEDPNKAELEHQASEGNGVTEEEKESESPVPELDSDTASQSSEMPYSPAAETFEGRVYVLPLTTYKFQPKAIAEFQETLLCLNLVDYGEPGGKQMLAIGTAKSTIEHEETNGHVYVYKVIEELEQDGDSDRNHSATGDVEKDDSKTDITTESNGHGNDGDNYQDDPPPIALEPFADQLVRGAVSSLTETMGFLAVAHGQQMHLYNFHKRLEPIGFFDTQIYTQDLKAMRNMIILGERLRGPRLVNFALQPHRLDLLASSDSIGPTPSAGIDTSTVSVTTAVEGISSAIRGDFAVVHTGADGRLQLFQYDPENPASNGGPRLVPLATFFTGRVCSSMTAAELYATNDIIAYGATTDGVVFSIKPLNEEIFRTMFVLTQQMMDKENPDAGLNPRMHRAMLSSLQNHSHQLIDVNYAQRFWHLSRNKQTEYARRLGYEGISRVQRALNSEGRDALKL